jgi:hypothetical protein
LCCLFICGLAASAWGQQPTVEYGGSSELQGVTKVFIDTGTDLDLRNIIAEEMQKSLPDLTVVSKPEDADIHLQFSFKDDREYGRDMIYPGLHPTIGIYGIPPLPSKIGVGTVVKVLGANRVRVLMSFKESRYRAGLSRRPGAAFAREFAKAYQQANPKK